MKKDVIFLAVFYLSLIMSGLYFYFFVKINEMPIQTYYFYHVILGLGWLLIAGLTNYLLWKMYQRSFGAMDSRQKRSIGVSVIVMALGAYLVIMSITKLM